jgi:hypothetical protein
MSMVPSPEKNAQRVQTRGDSRNGFSDGFEMVASRIVQPQGNRPFSWCFAQNGWR